MSDLDTIDYGLVIDLCIEQTNDFGDMQQADEGTAAPKAATQADMDKFARG